MAHSYIYCVKIQQLINDNTFKENEIKQLKDQLQYLQNQLEATQQQLHETHHSVEVERQKYFSFQFILIRHRFE